MRIVQHFSYLKDEILKKSLSTMKLKYLSSAIANRSFTKPDFFSVKLLICFHICC